MEANKQNKVKVSGCIVTYNNKEDVEICIDSILKYTMGVDLKLYVSDNLSTDLTATNIKEKFKDVTVIINNENNGFGAGHNVVIDKLDSKYHVIINPDIIIDNDVILELVNYMETNPSVGMITPKILNIDGSEQYLPKLRPRFKYLLGGRINALKHYRSEYTMQDVEITKPVEIDFCTGCFMVIRTDLFKKIRGFDDRYFMYFEDADLTREVKKSMKVIFYPYAHVYHKWSRASSKKIKYFIIQVQSMFRYYKKWHMNTD